MKYRSIIGLAAVLGFNMGLAAPPACADDDPDVSLINQPAKAETFGQRMAKARAAKKTHGAVKAPRGHKPKAVHDKAPQIPRAPKLAQIGN